MDLLHYFRYVKEHIVRCNLLMVRSNFVVAALILIELNITISAIIS